MEEIWKDVIEFKGRYQISASGLIRRKKPNIRLLNPCINFQGYPSVTLRLNGKTYVRNMHRLIAIHFIENPCNYPVVNHINGIRDDNRIENLEWCTQKHNIDHAISIGTFKTGKDHYLYNKKGKDCYNSKKVKNLVDGRVFDSLIEAAVYFKVSPSAIGLALKRGVRSKKYSLEYFKTEKR